MWLWSLVLAWLEHVSRGRLLEGEHGFCGNCFRSVRVRPTLLNACFAQKCRLVITYLFRARPLKTLPRTGCRSNAETLFPSSIKWPWTELIRWPRVYQVIPVVLLFLPRKPLHAAAEWAPILQNFSALNVTVMKPILLDAECFLGKKNKPCFVFLPLRFGTCLSNLVNYEALSVWDSWRENLWNHILWLPLNVNAIQFWFWFLVLPSKCYSSHLSFHACSTSRFN